MPPRSCAQVDLALEVDGSAAARAGPRAAGMSSVMRYWCSMASIGSSRPTMRPTSRAHRPPAFTTCSACTVPCSVMTSQEPSARWRRSVTRVCADDLGAADLRRLRVGVGDAVGIDVALDRVVDRADEMLLVDQRKQPRRPRRPRSARAPCRGSGRAPWSSSASPCRSRVPASIRPPVRCMPQDWPEIRSSSCRG